MDLTSWILLCLAVALILGLLTIRYSAWPVRNVFVEMGLENPPASKFFGNFFLGIKYGIFDAQTHFYPFFKEKKVYGWYDFKTPIIVIRDLDIIKDVCVKHFNNFPDRRVVLNMNPPFDHSLLAITGEHWKRVRSAVSPTFSSGRLKKMSRHVERNAKALQKVLSQKQESNEEIELKDMMSRLTMDTIASTGFGLDIDTLNNPDNEFSKSAKELTNPSITLFLVAMLAPFLVKMLETVGIKFMSPKASDFFEKAVDAALQERKESGSAGKMHDFLDLVINAEEKDSEETGEEGKAPGSLTRDEILSQALIFILGGYDTVSNVLAFTLFLLAVHPEYQKLVQEEIDFKMSGSADDSVPTYDLVQNLTYLDQCINETMRLFPPGFMLDRVCKEEITIQGIKFPKDMPVLVPVYAIHMDSDIWEEPKEFRPDRFSPENKEGRHQCSFFPFGHGPRNCIAMRLAQLELKVVLASVLRKFDVLSCNKTVYPVKLSTWQLAAKDGLWVRLERRNAK